MTTNLRILLLFDHELRGERESLPASGQAFDHLLQILLLFDYLLQIFVGQEHAAVTDHKKTTTTTTTHP